MLSDLFSGKSSRRRGSALFDQSLDGQLSDIRDDIASLTRLLAKRGDKASHLVRDRASDARSAAEAGFSDMMEGAEELLSDLRHRYASTERQVRHTVREHPLAAVGIIAAVGLLAVSMMRK
ncbi:hypothetical protein BJF93_23400 [Xaviernesmea oryzae]|uniref:DUF883 domain-containing protein n=1 Tax=Xaviernesmea oryzae TaxID=464029 RepID=A0A1Q9B2S5_9HYPH|nr:DUF883 family protein [Xaviernesmea oryzae]OLP62311.1 hypothetical protein BJF93_23400 [Xaviernesmea oryzae]SEL96414.1 Membrane-anchored ribosome-binding protein, inhibits growth in stationary phase, ElaB/YqjD/DUF883 family [Xaviernesmea oryzae]